MVSSVAIIGGGISGLTVAHKLNLKKIPLLVFDSETQLGGTIRSARIEDCLVDFGANSTISKPELNLLVSELGLHDQVLKPALTAKNRYIVGRSSTGRLRAISTPRSPSQLLTSQLLPFSGKLRALFEPIVCRTKLEDETVDSFFSRRFGSSVARDLVAPMLSGIWAADTKKLSMRSALETIWDYEQEYSSVLVGLICSLRQKSKNLLPKSPQLSAFVMGCLNLLIRS